MRHRLVVEFVLREYDGQGLLVNECKLRQEGGGDYIEKAGHLIEALGRPTTSADPETPVATTPQGQF